MSPARSAAGAAPWQNPLRDKRDKRLPRIAGPCAVVIFGVTGDLARKKVVPAIYDLANRGLLPPNFALGGVPPPRLEPRRLHQGDLRLRQGAFAHAVPPGDLGQAGRGMPV